MREGIRPHRVELVIVALIVVCGIAFLLIRDDKMSSSSSAPNKAASSSTQPVGVSDADRLEVENAVRQGRRPYLTPSGPEDSSSMVYFNEGDQFKAYGRVAAPSGWHFDGPMVAFSQSVRLASNDGQAAFIFSFETVEPPKGESLAMTTVLIRRRLEELFGQPLKASQHYQVRGCQAATCLTYGETRKERYQYFDKEGDTQKGTIETFMYLVAFEQYGSPPATQAVPAEDEGSATFDPRLGLKRLPEGYFPRETFSFECAIIKGDAKKNLEGMNQVIDSFVRLSRIP